MACTDSSTGAGLGFWGRRRAPGEETPAPNKANPAIAALVVTPPLRPPHYPYQHSLTSSIQDRAKGFGALPPQVTENKAKKI